MNIAITDSEWEVMRVVWSQGTTTSSYVVDILKQKKDWQPTTTKTLLARLVKKELLKTTKQGNRYLYSALVTESESWKDASNELFNHICAKKMGKHIALLIEDSPLSFDDLTLIHEALKEKEKYAVKDVQCDCIPGQCNCKEHCC